MHLQEATCLESPCFEVEHRDPRKDIDYFVSVGFSAQKCFCASLVSFQDVI